MQSIVVLVATIAIMMMNKGTEARSQYLPDDDDNMELSLFRRGGENEELRNFKMLYQLLKRGAPAQPKCKNMIHGMDYYKNDMAGLGGFDASSPVECAFFCERITECRAWSYTVNSLCHLKDKVPALQASGDTSYTGLCA